MGILFVFSLAQAGEKWALTTNIYMIKYNIIDPIDKIAATFPSLPGVCTAIEKIESIESIKKITQPF
jgi:hypothetical protein